MSGESTFDPGKRSGDRTRDVDEARFTTDKDRIFFEVVRSERDALMEENKQLKKDLEEIKKALKDAWADGEKKDDKIRDLRERITNVIRVMSEISLSECSNREQYVEKLKRQLE